MYQPKTGRNYAQDELDARSYGSFYADRGQSQSSGGDSRFYFSALAPTREDTQHGYSGDGTARFSMDNRGAFGDQSGQFINTVEAPSDEGQYNTGGRPIGYSGPEALAEEGGDEEGEEGEALAQLSADTSSGVPGMRSVKDATTGQYDIGVMASPPASVGSKRPPPPAQRSKPYKSSDVPRDKAKLISFITRLEQQHPGYSQAVYSSSTAKSVRLNTMRKLAEAGLI
jgi:hypothetical protein